jgi:hypothetical protein
VVTPNNDVLEVRVVALEKRMSNVEADAREMLEYKHSHDPLQKAWWEAQHKWNAQVGADIDTLRSCVVSLQKRWILVAGFAAALGGGVANLIGRMIP